MATLIPPPISPDGPAEMFPLAPEQPLGEFQATAVERLQRLIGQLSQQRTREEAMRKRFERLNPAIQRLIALFSPPAATDALARLGTRTQILAAVPGPSIREERRVGALVAGEERRERARIRSAGEVL